MITATREQEVREKKRQSGNKKKERYTEGNNGEVERRGKNLSKCLQPLNRLIAREGPGKSVGR